jgi:type VI secretion system protein ImpH
MSIWPQDRRVMERLLEEPYRFEFFQAVRLLERWFVERTEARQVDAVPHRIKFRTTLTTTFPPSEIEQATLFNEAGEPLADKAGRVEALNAGEVSHVDLTPTFFGMLGGQGALPLRYTEQIAAGEQLHRDRAARQFLDIFSNRATALFYAGWKKYRLPIHYELDRDERYLPLLQALAGVATDGARDALRDEPGTLIDDAVAGHSAAAHHRTLSAIYLQRTLSHYFKVAVRIEQFVGHFYDVPPQQQSQLGLNNVVLGATALVGERVWQRNLRVRLILGPMPAQQFYGFLPDAEQTAALARLLCLLVGISLEYEVCPVLQRDAVRPVQLGRHGALGYDSFLTTRASDIDRSDLNYMLIKASRRKPKFAATYSMSDHSYTSE